MRTNGNDTVSQMVIRGIDMRTDEYGYIPNLDANPLTKREYFASMIMQGMVTTTFAITNISAIAMKAVKAADELIAALNE